MTGARDTGFTLVETLIALFALSLLSAAGASLLISTVDGRRLLETRSERIRDLDLANALLKQDIAALTARSADAPESFGQGASLRGGFRSEGEILELVRNGWENPQGVFQRGGVQRVVYRLEEGRLIRAAARRPDALRATPVDERVLLEGVSELRLAFINGDLRAERWDSAQAGGVSLFPAAVEVAVSFETGETLRQLFLAGGRT
ncbi:MAG: type II secretion system minor pseudopilin GspJ [Pseudomonadota bacterium]